MKQHPIVGPLFLILSVLFFAGAAYRALIGTTIGSNSIPYGIASLVIATLILRGFPWVRLRLLDGNRQDFRVMPWHADDARI